MNVQPMSIVSQTLVSDKCDYPNRHGQSTVGALPT